MGLKDFNYKQYGFDHGEKIGLAVAGAVALLLGIWLIVPGSGLFAPSADARARDLQQAADKVTKGLSSNQPEDADKPPGNISERLVAFAFDVIPDAAIEQKYRVAGLFDGRQGGPGGRQMPSVKQPTESDVALVHFQLPSLIYDPDGNYLMTLKGVTESAGPGGPGGMNPNAGGTSGGGKMPSPGVGMGGGFSAPGRFNGNAGNLARKRGLVKNRKDTDTDKADRDYDVDWKKIDDKDLPSSTLAMQPFPVRAVEIVGGFPYGDQIEEFRQKLALPTKEAVLAEGTFRFKGMEVQRRTLDSQGRPLDDKGVLTTPDGGWATLDLKDAYATLTVLGGGVDKWEPETRFHKVAFLALHRLPTFGDLQKPPIDEYPKLEDNLPNLKKTVDDLDTNKRDANVAKPPFTQRPDENDLWGLNSAAGAQTGPGPGGTGGGPMPGPGPGPKGLGVPPGGSTGSPINPNGPGNGPMGSTGGESVIPDYCLIRLFDFTIETGKTYEYRMRVVMANPNYGRTDVASPGIALDDELNKKPADKDWYVVPKKVTVSPDLYYYAVDQVKLDAKDPAKDKDKDKDTPKLPLQPVKTDSQTVLQIQKWVDFLTVKRTDLKLGDWVIADRVVATRGEPIGRQRVEVPYWRYQQNRFTMAFDQSPRPNDKKYVASVDVPFAPDGQEPILVDFTGGDVTYKRTHPKTDDATPPAVELPIADKAPEEVLLWTADGKLLAHNGAKDAEDPDRIKRLDDVRKWIESVKKQKGGKDDKGLFPDRPGTPSPMP